MSGALEKINKWIIEQVVYKDDGDIDDAATTQNYLQVCGENGSIEIKSLSHATGVTRSQFYQNKEVGERIKELRKNLNNKYPNYFVGEKKKNNTPKDKEIETPEYDKTGSLVKELARDKSKLEKMLHQERAKSSRLEKDIIILRNKMKLYEPTINAMQKLGIMPSPNIVSEDDA
ncbi:MAG: hypothetical protein QM500_00780 [Methylococcales bacterium]